MKIANEGKEFLVEIQESKKVVGEWPQSIQEGTQTLFTVTSNFVASNVFGAESQQAVVRIEGAGVRLSFKD